MCCRGAASKVEINEFTLINSNNYYNTAVLEPKSMIYSMLRCIC